MVLRFVTPRRFRDSIVLWETEVLEVGRLRD